MKQTAILLTLGTVLVLSACGGETSLPEATGKASVRAINAISRSHAVDFRIQERSIDSVGYRGASTLAQYDDLDYTFNFDVVYAGDTETTRIASQDISFVTGQEYTLLLSGTLANAAVTVWETTQRVFGTEDTVFQVRFAHTSEFLAGSVDFFIAAAGVAPVAGEEVATLSFGEISPALDLEAGAYVISITTAGDPMDILFTSDEIEIAARSDFIISPFDGTENYLSDITVQVIGGALDSTRLVDSSNPATVQFLHAAMDLGTSDIYDDETLLSQVLANHAYTELTTELPITPGDITFRYTPASSTAAITLEGDLVATAGLRYRFIAKGENADFSTIAMLPDRRPVETAAKILLLQTSNNYEYLDFYLVGQGETLDDQAPLRLGLGSGAPSAALGVAAGSYDLYVTETLETEILAGPLSVDLALGDVIDLAVFDTAVPSELDIRILASP